jgi:hypothetical protein
MSRLRKPPFFGVAGAGGAAGTAVLGAAAVAGFLGGDLGFASWTFGVRGGAGEGADGVTAGAAPRPSTAGDLALGLVFALAIVALTREPGFAAPHLGHLT